MFTDCLQSFTELEELEESELYMCSTCKKKQRSTKKFWIRRLPNVITSIKPLNLFFVILILLRFFFLIVYLTFGVRIFFTYTLQNFHIYCKLWNGYETNEKIVHFIHENNILKTEHIYLVEKNVCYHFSINIFCRFFVCI